MDKQNQEKYESPKLKIYGDLRKITQKKKGIVDSLAMISH